MGNAPHMKGWHPILQYLCGLLTHKDRNYSGNYAHYAYCMRCGKLFGHPWGGHK